jgi:phage baseplate assembly protein W
MHPTFGSTIYELLFEPSVDGDVSSAALSSIRDAAKEWMPFITVQDTFVTFNESTANIKVSYSIKELDIIEILEMNIRI